MSEVAFFADFWRPFLIIINFIYIITAIIVSISVIMDNRNPAKTISWIIILFLLPFIGLIIYFMVGQNYRKQKIFTRKGMEDFKRIQSLREKQLIEIKEDDFIEDENIRKKLHIIKLLLKNNKALLTRKNKTEILNNGSRIFGSIKSALKNAKDHIHIEFYIIEDDRIGNEIKDILIEKANEGVKVRLIYDDVGSWKLSGRFIDSLRRAGVEVNPFMPVKFPFLANRLNYRNHRKIIIIDGKTGFVGGINIADRYLYGDRKIKFWRDTHLKIEGEAVSSLQAVFLIDWHFVCGRLLDEYRYFPKTAIRKSNFVQIISSGPDSDWASIMQSFFSAITTAREYIYITVPYFIPNESILTALKTVSLSGTEVSIILPAKSDSWLAYYGTMSYVEELLEAGINVYTYQKGFVHSKLIMVDDIFSSVGTANMDIRSFDDNFEVNALIYDEDTTAMLKKHFLEDLRECKKISPEEYMKRPLSRKFFESVARLFSPLL